MNDENQIIGRRLPPELLAEMHKCLSLADAINVLVNVPTRAIYQNNSPRMRRTIQRIKTSLNEYIGTLVGDESENNREELRIKNNIEWKPQLGTLLRYGNWLTKTQQFTMFSRNIIGVPENFLEELLLHLANSSLTQMMLKRVAMNFEMEQIPIPSFLKKLFNVKQNRRILFEYVNLETDNDGQTLPIFEGELYKCYPGYKLRLIIAKMAKNNWFQILLTLDSTKEFIRRLELECTKWPLDSKFKFLLGWSSNVFEAKENIMWTPNLDMFLRRGAGLTPIQHFRMKKQYYFNSLPTRYINFLINYISNTKYPNEFLESIDINFANRCCSSSSFIDKIYHNEIPKGGKFINIDGTKKLHILSAKIAKTNKKLEFTLANIPTNGQYRFDVIAEFAKGSTKIIRIKIIKRKIENIIQLKYQNKIEQGKKRKTTTTNDNDDEPTYSGKIMKK